MKKIKLFVLALVFSFVLSTNVNAAIPTASTNLDYPTCISFSDVFKTISTKQGSYYYKFCYRATCVDGNYIKANMVANSAYRCQNGNGTPYTKVTSDGCKSYNGKCNTQNATYCTKVLFIDCNKNKDGSAFKNTLTTQTTTRKTTTKKKTTVKTTKKTTKRTTKRTGTTTTKVIIPVTSKTTTTKQNVNLSNTKIKKILINSQEIIYNNESSIDLKVPYGLNNIDVKVILEDPKATYVVNGNNNMADEDSTITITVTAQDGTKRNVLLNVIRYNMENNDCNLANIYIDGYDIDFSKSVYEYKLTLPKKVKSLDIEIIPVDEEQVTYEIDGNSKLENKSKITIVVTAENGNECTYVINIKKHSNTWKYVLLIILLLGALGTSSYFLFKYLKKSKGKYKYE